MLTEVPAQTSNLRMRGLTRMAGAMGLVGVLLGGFGYRAGVSRIVDGNGLASLTHVLADEQMWRLGTAALVGMVVCRVVAAALLYVVFERVDRTLSLIAVALALVAGAVLGAGLLMRFVPIVVTHGSGAAEAVANNAAPAMLVSLELFRKGFVVALAFSGWQCLLLGWLALRSRLLPRAIGGAISLAGLLYLVNSGLDIVSPHGSPSPGLVIVANLAELAFSVWLLAKGVDDHRWTSGSNASDG